MTDRIYLDHAATSPLRPEVIDAMAPWATAGSVGNPSSLHEEGRRAREAVEDARDQIAAALGVPPLDVVFTSGGTESDNQAVKGLTWAAINEGKPSGVITTEIEHSAVGDTVQWLASATPATAQIVPVGASGIVEVNDVVTALDQAEKLGRPIGVAAVMAANNEVGTIQPVPELGRIFAERGIAFHVDAVQALSYLPVDPTGWNAATVAISGHKLGGPIGVGALISRRDASIVPVLHGGRQERGIRSGTLNVAGIVGMGAAVVAATNDQERSREHIAGLRDRLLNALLALDGVSLNGDRDQRLANNLHIAVTGWEPETLLMELDREGISCSTGSACQSGAAKRSHVLEAIGAAPGVTHLRFTLGWTTTSAQISAAIERITTVLERREPVRLVGLTLRSS